MARLTRGLTSKQWYLEGSLLGIYPTISTTDDIRVYCTKAPTALSAKTDSGDALLEDYEDGILYFAAWRKATKQAAALMAKGDDRSEKFAALAAYYKGLWEEMEEECGEEQGLQQIDVDSVSVDPGSHYTEHD